MGLNVETQNIVKKKINISSKIKTNLIEFANLEEKINSNKEKIKITLKEKLIIKKKIAEIKIIKLERIKKIDLLKYEIEKKHSLINSIKNSEIDVIVKIKDTETKNIKTIDEIIKNRDYLSKIIDKLRYKMVCNGHEPEKIRNEIIDINNNNNAVNLKKSFLSRQGSNSSSYIFSHVAK